MGTWNIKDQVSNLFPEGEYNFRLDSVTPGESKNPDKNGNTNPTLRFTWVCVGGSEDGKKQFQTFTLRADVLGIIGANLAASQCFEDTEELPDDKESLGRIIEERMGGKVFAVKYGHRLDKATQRVWPSIEIIGPSSAAFA